MFASLFNNLLFIYLDFLHFCQNVFRAFCCRFVIYVGKDKNEFCSRKANFNVYIPCGPKGYTVYGGMKPSSLGRMVCEVLVQESHDITEIQLKMVFNANQSWNPPVPSMQSNPKGQSVSEIYQIPFWLIYEKLQYHIKQGGCAGWSKSRNIYKCPKRWFKFNMTEIFLF